MALAAAVRRARGVESWAGWTLVAALAGNGLGSMGFHGPGDRISRALHDATLAVLVPISVAGVVRALIRDPAAAARSLATPLVALAAGGLLARLGRTGAPWCRPRSLVQPHAAWHLLAAAAVTSAARRTWGSGAERT
jgi:hypothetical protein